ncbi:MAG: hypothetical protein IKR92_02280 [Alphaproteobacteria bacterium]|nr:hypothetical protein [Alphaproteobacteria bacterium]
MSIMFVSNIVPVAAQQYPPAPVDKILQKQIVDKDKLAKYRRSIVNSYKLQPKQLQNLLDSEYDEINRDTKRMQNIKKNWKSFPYAYHFANYMLNAQISAEITQSRKKFIARKKRFEEILKNTPQGEPIYIIEANDPLFFIATIRQNPDNKVARTIKMTYMAHELNYISVFDSTYKHLFTYHRQHIDMLQNRRIVTTLNTKNKEVNQSYQKLFDDYLTDMKRIGAGLDINNPNMFREIEQMQNAFRSK